MTADSTAVITIAGLMELAARTAPKAEGVDNNSCPYPESKRSPGPRESPGGILREMEDRFLSTGCKNIRHERLSHHWRKREFDCRVNGRACSYANCEEFTKEC